MLSDLIPNYEAEMDQLRAIGTKGFFLGFGINLRGAEYMQIEYPPKWQAVYEQHNYYIADPVVVWVFAKSGATRWSEIALPDIRGVLNHAKDFGLNYGATFSRRAGLRRSFLSVGRDDREVTTEEMTFLSSKFDTWVEIVMGRASLTDDELTVLQCLRDGLAQREIANELGIAETTVKQRAIKATKKLGAKNRTHAVAIAVQRRYFDS